jgi:hypothetical protein
MKLGKNLNLTFGKTIVRNVPESVVRLYNFKKYADVIELEYEVFESIRGDLYVPNEFDLTPYNHQYPHPANQYFVGNFLSSMLVHLYVMSKRYESYIVCDDDTVFGDLDLKLIKDYLPDDWDIIILGKISPPKYNELGNTEIEPRFTRAKIGYVSGCHCVAINQKFYFTFLLSLLQFQTNKKFGDGMIDDFIKCKQANVYDMLPDITYQERNLLKPYVFE